MHVYRGELQLAERLLERGAAFRDSADQQDRTAYLAAQAVVLGALGRHDEALATASGALADGEPLGPDSQGMKVGLVAGVEAALALGDLDRAEELVAVVEQLRPGQRPPFLDAQASRFRTRLAAARGRSDQVEPGFKASAGLLRELSMPFWLGVVLLEHGEWPAAQDRPDEAAPLLEEAGTVFERLGARPWADRLRLSGGEQPPCRRADSSPSPHRRSSP
jgi:hypothetical protein